MENGERVFLLVFGAILIGVGVLGIFQDHLSWGWRIGGSLMVAIVGGNSIWCGYRGKASWLSRLGGLP